MLRNRVRALGTLLALSAVAALGVLGAPTASAASPKPTVPARTGAAAACPVPAGKPTMTTASCSSRPSRMQPAFTYAVSLTVNPVTPASGGSVTLTATANLDVTTTPYYIEIFDNISHTLVGDCGLGSVCPVPVSHTGCVAISYVAYITAPFTTGQTSAAIDAVATSSFQWVAWGANVSLGASPTSPAPGGSVTLTATSCLDVGPTPWFVQIYDLSASPPALLASVGSGTLATASAGPFASGTLHSYVALIGSPAIAVSAPVFLTWP